MTLDGAMWGGGEHNGVEGAGLADLPGLTDVGIDAGASAPDVLEPELFDAAAQPTLEGVLRRDELAHATYKAGRQVAAERKFLGTDRRDIDPRDLL